MESATVESQSDPPSSPPPANTAGCPPPVPTSTATRSSTLQMRASRGRGRGRTHKASRYSTALHRAGSGSATYRRDRRQQPVLGHRADEQGVLPSSSAKPSPSDRRRLPPQACAANSGTTQRPPRKFVGTPAGGKQQWSPGHKFSRRRPRKFVGTAAGGKQQRSPGYNFSNHCMLEYHTPVVKQLVPGSRHHQPCQVWLAPQSCSQSQETRTRSIMPAKKVAEALTYYFSIPSDPFKVSPVHLHPGIYFTSVSCRSVASEIVRRGKCTLGKDCFFLAFSREEEAIQFQRRATTVFNSNEDETEGSSPTKQTSDSDARPSPPSPIPTTDLTSGVSVSQESKAASSSVVNKDLRSPRDVPGETEVNPSEEQVLEMLSICTNVSDYTDPTKDVEEKDLKGKKLRELVDYIKSATGKFSEPVMQEVIRMVSVNLFRVTTPALRENKALESFDMEEKEPVTAEDPAWPHLDIVYELLCEFIKSPEMDTKQAKSYINHGFIIRLLDLFDSEDPIERKCLKANLHPMYEKFKVHRPFIRKEINNIFYRFIFETEKHNGIAELLEILGSIIRGFALPLKEEHKLFLVRALIPLHKPKFVAMYHQQLSYCVTQFVEKDCKLADTVIRGLLKCWPITNSSKEVMFLGELEEVLEATQPAEFQRCMVSLFRQIARCLSSSHFQVAERALFLWNIDHIESLIKQNSKVILPIIYPALERNTKGHWNQAVQSLSLNVRKIFMDHDPALFEECRKKFEEEEAQEAGVRSKREARWKRLEEIASSKSPQ